MLVRDDDLVIAQPAHAWISGQLARAWADEPTPYETVCLAAEQHDVGWTDADLEPLLNAETGRPLSFVEMPLEVHLGIWGDAPRRMLAQSRYAALLVSLHGTSLYSRREPTPRIQAYLDAQRALQASLAAGLDPDEVDRNRRLLLAWDHISLALCLGWDPVTIPGVPGYGELVLAGGRLSPWPFATGELRVSTEARLLPGRFEDEESLRAALREAEWVPMEFTLRPGEAATGSR